MSVAICAHPKKTDPVSPFLVMLTEYNWLPHAQDPNA